MRQHKFCPKTNGGATLVYDKNGNLTDDATALLLKWDALNRLREARRRADRALIAVYAYDAKNRRMRKTVSNGGVGNDSGLNGIADFTFDGWKAIEEREPDFQAGTDTTVRQMTYGIYLDEVWTVDMCRDGLGVMAGEKDGQFFIADIRRGQWSPLGAEH